MNVVRSVVQGVISSCKTETSMKPVPMALYLAEMLKKWKDEAVYASPDVACDSSIFFCSCRLNIHEIRNHYTT
jgi:hypothetical protein